MQDRHYYPCKKEKKTTEPLQRKLNDAGWTNRTKGCMSKQAVNCVTCIDCLASSLEQQQLIKGFKYVNGGLVNGAHNCAACIDNVSHCAHHNGCCSCVQPCTTRKRVWDAASRVWGLSDCAQQHVSASDALRSAQSSLSCMRPAFDSHNDAHGRDSYHSVGSLQVLHQGCEQSRKT